METVAANIRNRKTGWLLLIAGLLAVAGTALYFGNPAKANSDNLRLSFSDYRLDCDWSNSGSAFAEGATASLDCEVKQTMNVTLRQSGDSVPVTRVDHSLVAFVTGIPCGTQEQVTAGWRSLAVRFKDDSTDGIDDNGNTCLAPGSYSYELDIPADQIRSWSALLDIYPQVADGFYGNSYGVPLEGSIYEWGYDDQISVSYQRVFYLDNDDDAWQLRNMFWNIDDLAGRDGYAAYSGQIWARLKDGSRIRHNFELEQGTSRTKGLVNQHNMYIYETKTAETWLCEIQRPVRQLVRNHWQQIKQHPEFAEALDFVIKYNPLEAQTKC